MRVVFPLLINWKERFSWRYHCCSTLIKSALIIIIIITASHSILWTDFLGRESECHDSDVLSSCFGIFRRPTRSARLGSRSSCSTLRLLQESTCGLTLTLRVPFSVSCARHGFNTTIISRSVISSWLLIMKDWRIEARTKRTVISTMTRWEKWACPSFSTDSCRARRKMNWPKSGITKVFLITMRNDFFSPMLVTRSEHFSFARVSRKDAIASLSCKCSHSLDSRERSSRLESRTPWWRARKSNRPEPTMRNISTRWPRRSSNRFRIWSRTIKRTTCRSWPPIRSDRFTCGWASRCRVQPGFKNSNSNNGINRTWAEQKQNYFSAE